MSERLLLVGEDYGDTVADEYCTDALALTGKSGQRLANLAGLTLLELVERTDRTNVVRRPADWKDPVVIAWGVITVIEKMRDRRVLLLGSKVAEALCVRRTLFTWHPAPASFRVTTTYACLPHPSGRSRYWNEPENVEMARQFLTEVFDAE